MRLGFCDAHEHLRESPQQQTDQYGEQDPTERDAPGVVAKLEAALHLPKGGAAGVSCLLRLWLSSACAAGIRRSLDGVRGSFEKSREKGFFPKVSAKAEV